MKSWSMYDMKTGLFSRKSFSGPNHWRPRLTEGMVLLEGEYDHLSQCVDLESGEVVDYQPPRPSDDHEWIHDDPDTGRRVRRWMLKPAVTQRRAQLAAAKAELEQIDLALIRPMEELMADPKDATARAKFQELKARKAEIVAQSGVRGPQ